MDITKVKVNGFILKPLRNGYYAVLNDNNKKLVYLDNDLNRCLNMMTDGFALAEGADGVELTTLSKELTKVVEDDEV